MREGVIIDTPRNLKRALDQIDTQHHEAILESPQPESLEDIQIKDFSQRLFWRSIVVGFFCFLLVAQHIFVFSVVARAATYGYLQDIASTVNVLIISLVGETYLILRVIVNFLFNEIKYKRPE